MNVAGAAATDSFSFDARIVPGSLVRHTPLQLSEGLSNASRKAYKIGNLDELKEFNQSFSDSQQVSFDDLATHTYFLFSASGCAAYSELAGADYGTDRVTIKINRVEPEQDTVCIAADTATLAVLSGEKLHAPEIPFETIELQSQSHIDDERLEIISDAAAWAALWEEHHRGISPRPALPEIDFSEKTIVAVYIGMRPNGCYGVRIDRIYRSGEKNIVEYTERTPSEEDICTQALVSPSHLVVIPKTPYPFELRKNVPGR